MRKLWEAACASKSLHKSDGRLWHAASGSYRHFEARGVPILKADGSVREWVGTCLDFTARKEADDAVARAAERFRVAFDNAPIGMALLTPDGRWFQVKSVNAQTAATRPAARTM